MSAGASRLSDFERRSEGSSRYRLRDFFTPTMRAVEDSLAQGRCDFLHVMDSSKLGWRSPSAACLDEIAQRRLTEAWSPNPAQAQRNVQHILDRIAHVLVKIELLLDRGMAATLPDKSAFEV
jgi:hypothetical protein